MDLKIGKVTIAVTKINEMVNFYTTIFSCDFKKIDAYNNTLYMGEIKGVKILLCPNEIADVKAEQNRFQFDFYVKDIKKLIIDIETSGGRIIGKTEGAETLQSVSVMDPDGNTMVFIQKSTVD
ncbi:MAG: hypothetical protein GY810_11090 [Aureispira sp.]|nr:hypothetical protein [Aureispira sp.]